MVVYDRVLPNEASHSLYGLALGVVIAIVFDILLKRAKARIIERSTVTSDKGINEEIFAQFVETIGTKNKKPIGELATIMRDVEVYRDFMSSATILTLIDIPFALLFVFVIYLVAGPLFLIPLVCIPLIIVLILAVQPFMAKNSLTVSLSSQTRQGLLVEVLRGLNELRTSGAFKLMRKKFLEKSLQYSEATQKAKSYAQINENIIYLIQQLAQVAVIVYGFHLFVTQNITMGAIIATVILSGRTLSPLARVAQTLGRANTAIQARSNVKEFLLTAVPSYEEETNFPSSSEEAIKIVNVTLKLSELGKPFFNNFDLSIPAGQKVAIVGRSGSGKSSLLKMTLGLNHPETGTVLIRGRDVRQYSRTNLFKTLGVTFQEPWLFSGTLRENIGLGYEDCSDDMIKNCLIETGGIFGGDPKTIDLDFKISDQGGNLSGGQRQSITLARALVFEPDILFLDEPTSAMDVKTENATIQGLNKYCSDKTLLVITHKLSLVRMCQRVIIIDKGTIIWDDKIEKYIELMSSQIGKKR